MIQREREGGTIDVVADKRGAPTWTRDVADHLPAAAAYGPGVVHLTNAGDASRYEQPRDVFRLLGADPHRVRPIPSATQDRAPARPTQSSPTTASHTSAPGTAPSSASSASRRSEGSPRRTAGSRPPRHQPARARDCHVRTEWAGRPSANRLPDPDRTARSHAPRSGAYGAEQTYSTVAFQSALQNRGPDPRRHRPMTEPIRPKRRTPNDGSSESPRAGRPPRPTPRHGTQVTSLPARASA